MRMLISIVLICSVLSSSAQINFGIVSGAVRDINNKPLEFVTVAVTDLKIAVITSDIGKYSIKIPSGQKVTLIFSAAGYVQQDTIIFLNANENEHIDIRLKPLGVTLETVTISDEKIRKEAGLIQINADAAMNLPGAVGGVEGLIKTLVGSNNELSSQYNVRGGNYDENLVYINDYEIYRPYLVSSGQQEGLSLINATMVRNVNFYTGGFQSKYGDKMSSVLDIQYKKPVSFGGSFYMGLLEQGLQFEGASKNGKFSYLTGFRNKSNRNLLSSQATTGAYIPSASDAQLFFTYKISDKLQAEVLGILSSSRFTFYPESVKKTTAVFSPFYTANLGLDVYFEGREKDNYSTSLAGITLIQAVSNKLKFKWMFSRFKDAEKENFDIAGTYLFGDRDFNQSSGTFGQIVNPLGAGYYQNYGRNKLNIEVYSLSHKGYLDAGKHYLQWGITKEQTHINDVLNQFEYRDSAGYSLPYSPTALQLYNVRQSAADLNIQKYSGFLQDNIRSLGKNKNITVQAGMRFNYNSLNQEFLISPRAQLSYKPSGKKDIVYKLAAGVYDQPPFYRELRNQAGQINTNIKAQKSVQFVAGADHSFVSRRKSQMRITAEAYYKSMTHVIPYDIENVKISYLGNNNAKAYATGVEFRLFGQLVKDAESWISVGLMRTREDLQNDIYYDYKNAAGQIINASTADKVATDSTANEAGYVRRPTDRLITVGVYIEDYLPSNKNFKVFLNGIYGSNMSYNIPGSVKYRNALIIQPYIRVDMGFSVLLLNEKAIRRSHSPFRSFKSIWLSAEIFNLVNRANTISFQLIKDFSNTVYALPDRLTPRLLNLKLAAKF